MGVAWPRQRILPAAAVVVAVLSWGAVARQRQPGSYGITLLGGIPGAAYPGAEAINNRGQVVVMAGLADGTQRSYLWSNGRLTDLGSLGGTRTWARDLNDRGQVVGESDTARNEHHSFLWERGTMRDLGTLGGRNSGAWGINNGAQVVGQAETRAGEMRAFLWAGGRMVPLRGVAGERGMATHVSDRGVIAGSALFGGAASGAFVWQSGTIRRLGVLPGYDIGTVFGMNSRGQVVGRDERSGLAESAPTRSAAFLWDGQKVAELRGLGGTAHSAFGINASGQVVGVSFATRNGQRAFLITNGRTVDLNDLLPRNSGWGIHWARDINDRGEIVGSGKYRGKSCAYLITPG